jgi:hypothetical protein
MVTAPATPIARRREMVEVKAPEQFQFTKQGQEIEGTLVSMEPIDLKGKEAIEYLFQRDNKQRFTCLGTADLNKKLNPQMIGHFVWIRYATDDASFQKPGQSPMKVFEVRVSKEKESGF